MGYLFLLSSAILWVGMILILKESGRRKFSLVTVLTPNYLTCALAGWLTAGGSPVAAWAGAPEVFWIMVPGGILFISVFFLTGKVADTSGMGFVALVTRMSMVLPVLYAAVFAGESLSAIRIMGMAMALGAIWLVNYQPGVRVGQGAYGLMLMLFLGSGVVDTLFKVFDHQIGSEVPMEAFLSGIFGMAGISGLFVVLLRRMPVSSGALVAGVLLGLTNFVCTWLFMHGLAAFEGPLFFPLNNLLQLFLATGVGVWIYRETFTIRTAAGLGLAGIAILVMTLEGV